MRRGQPRSRARSFNIVSVYNRGEEHGQLWIAMPYVDGTDAAVELADDRHAMTPLRALRIITEVGKVSTTHTEKACCTADVRFEGTHAEKSRKETRGSREIQSRWWTSSIPVRTPLTPG